MNNSSLSFDPYEVLGSVFVFKIEEGVGGSFLHINLL